MAPDDNNRENSSSRLERMTGEAMIPRTDGATTQKFLTKVAVCLLPLALTPVLGFLISDGYLNLGGGCKDIILLIPWLLWSLVYSLFFIVLWIRGRSLGRLTAYSIAGASGVIVLVWIMLYCFLWYPGQPVPTGDYPGY
jgi:hypothetical protein